MIGGIAIVQDMSGLAMLDAAEAGTLTDAAAIAFDTQFATIGVAQTVAYILAAIAYLAWLSRSVDVTPRLGGGTPSVTPRWAIGWWFIPFANLVKPYLIVADLYRRMAPVAGIGTGIVLAWWVLWIANNILTNAAGRVWLAAVNLDGLRTGLQMYALSDLVDPICALLAILVVLRIQNWADSREARPAPPEVMQAADVAAAPPS